MSHRCQLVACLLTLLTVGVLCGDDVIPEEDCKLLDIPKCQIHVVDRALLATERDGVVSVVRVRVGDAVDKGAPLVELRSEIAEARLQLADERTKSDINERYSMKVREVAEQEYRTALELHAKQALNDQILRQRKLEAERSALSVEQAQFDAKL